MKTLLKTTFVMSLLLVGGISLYAAPLQPLIDQYEAGDVIELPAGVYTGTAQLKDGQTLVGAGAGETVLDGKDAGYVLIGARDTVIIGVTVRNAEIGIHNQARCMGIFESDFEDLRTAIKIEGGCAVIANNRISGNEKSVGIDCIAANPLITENLIMNHAVGFRAFHKYNPVLSANTFISNRVAIQVGPNVVLSTDRNIFDGNTHLINGAELADSDRVEPVSVDDIKLVRGAGVEQYRTLMDVALRERVSQHPVVLYSLTEQPGQFGMGTLFPWSEFSVSASAMNTHIASHFAFDIKTDDPLQSVYENPGQRPTVKVSSEEPKEKEAERYVLDTLFQHPESYYFNDQGQLVFSRLTNISRIEIYCPAGFVPVDINFDAKISTVNDRYVAAFTDAGFTQIELVMEPVGQTSDPLGILTR